MAAGDGIFDKVGNDPVQTGSLLSLLPSLLIHGAVVLTIWLGLFADEPVQIPVTMISLAPAPAPSADPAPPAPMVPAPELEPEFEPLRLPATGIALPQPEPPTEVEQVVDFTPPELPEPESFPFDPQATRAPEPVQEDAAPLEKVEEKPKPKEPERPKETKKKQEKPKKKETKKVAATAVAEQMPAQPAAPPKPIQTAATQAKAVAPAAPARTASKTAPATAPDQPLQVTDPNYAGHCPRSYPKRAIRRNLEGTVVIQAQLGSDGKAVSVIVKQSSGHAILDENAREMILACEFTPRKVGGVPVRVVVEIPIPYVLK
jgi:protein TonB